MPYAILPTASRAPVGWRPQTEIDALFPALAEMRRALLPEIRIIEGGLDQEEAAGNDTARSRLNLRELRWRLEYTADIAAIVAAYERLRAPEQDGCGAGAEIWFLQLDAMVDHMLAPDFEDRGELPDLLDRVNGPDRLGAYLDGLLVSRLAEDGIDRRKELNFATGDLVRLILRSRPRKYPWDARLEMVMRQFVAVWQDPVTGFFGADYLLDGHRLRTVDLSMTFHMARYLEGRIGYWPELIDTLFRIREDRYPSGWLDEAGMTCHNNYDVAVLLQLGWPHMRADQRCAAREELGRLLDWCLTVAIAPDGRLMNRAIGESLPESYYFTVAFLDTVGYFDSARRFWTDRSYPDAPLVQARLEHRLQMLPQGDPMVRMAFERLQRPCTAAGRSA